MKKRLSKDCKFSINTRKSFMRKLGVEKKINTKGDIKKVI